MDDVVASVLLLAAGAAGGALNAVAGGGSFVVFPVLLFSGVPPVAANATTTVALWPAGLASAAAYRDHLPKSRAQLLALSIASALGGAAGAKLLLFTSDQTFAHILPWLMLTAASVFTFGPRVTRWLRGGAASDAPPAGITRRQLAGIVGLQLVIATYGGYFGGGMGIMVLAALTLVGMTHLHEMNALKVVLGTLVNGVALVAFLFAGKVVLGRALLAAVGSIVGGWFGAALARRLDPKYVRWVVLVVAWSMTIWFFVRGIRR